MSKDEVSLRRISATARGWVQLPTDGHTLPVGNTMSSRLEAGGADAPTEFGIGHNGGPPLTEIEKIGRLPDCAVLTTKQIAVLTGLSVKTVRGLGANGPPRVQLSKFRVGYPLGGYREWLKRSQSTEMLPPQGGYRTGSRKINGEAA